MAGNAFWIRRLRTYSTDGRNIVLIKMAEVKG
jgi:hypothetical protein